MYVCGITPYDATHLGHAATYLAFDLVQRVWRDAGHQVRYVQNVTDVDDPLLERATHTGENWMSLAEREIQLFREDMTALRVLPPNEFVGAVESIPEITDAIARLLEDGNGLRAGRGHLLPGRRGAAFRQRVQPRPRRRCSPCSPSAAATRSGRASRMPLDSVLWRGRRPGEPFWDTPLGPGRPGWHIECSVIALNRLGMGFDVQGGGSDLVVPAPRALRRPRRGAHRRRARSPGTTCTPG